MGCPSAARIGHVGKPGKYGEGEEMIHLVIGCPRHMLDRGEGQVGDRQNTDIEHQPKGRADALVAQ